MLTARERNLIVVEPDHERLHLMLLWPASTRACSVHEPRNDRARWSSNVDVFRSTLHLRRLLLRLGGRIGFLALS